MANRNPRLVQFQEKDLSQGGRLPSDLPEVANARNTGEGMAQVAKSLDVFSERVGKYADDAMKVEASHQAKLDVASGAFAPQGGSTLRAQAYDETGGQLYLSKLSADFDAQAADLYTQNRDNPAGFRQGFEQLRSTFQRDHVFPEMAAAFDAKATRSGTAYLQSALSGFEQKQKDQARATFLEGMTANETARQRALSADPNAPGVDALVDGMAGEQVARIRAMVSAGHMSAQEGAKLEMTERNYARSSVVLARANKLGSAGEVETLLQTQREAFTAGNLKMDGQAFSEMEGELLKVAKAKRVAGSEASRVLDGEISSFLDRQGKGFQPSAAELASLSMKAEALGPEGSAKLEALRQKLWARRTIDALPIERADAVIAQFKRDVSNASANAGPHEQEALAFFKARGWSPLAAAAIVGNLANEGLHSTTARNPGDGRDGSDSIGIAQWNGERAQALKAFASARGKDWHDRETQLAFVDQELRSSEGKWGQALAQARAPEEAAKAMISYFRPAGWSESAPDAGHNYAGRLAATKRLGSVGLSALAADVVSDAEMHLKKRRELLNTDPLRAAEAAGTIAQIAPLDWNAGPALGAQLNARMAQAEAVAEANGRAPTYLRPDEKDRLREKIQAGGPEALKLVTGIVEGSGARARAILGEMESSAPRLAAIGRMVAHGAPEQLTAARDAFEALRMEQAPGVKTVERPKTSGVLEREVLGGAYGADVQSRQRVIDAAQLIYKGQMARKGLDPDTLAGANVYKEALQLAVGKSGGQSAVGGVAEYAMPWGKSNAKVVVPENVKTNSFREVIQSLTAQDLEEAPGGRPEVSGTPYTLRDIKSAYPVRVQGGYAFSQDEPGTDTPKMIRRADGKVFVLDWQWYQARARNRVPHAFAG